MARWELVDGSQGFDLPHLAILNNFIYKNINNENKKL